MPILEERAFSEVEHVGVAITETGPGTYHCGFLFQLDNQPPQILHLAFHHRLEQSDAAEPYRWVNIGIDGANKRVLAGQISQLRDGSPNVPYGFDAQGVAFDPATGSLLPPPIGKGLTCATFIDAALRSFGYPPLVDEATWPMREDDQPRQVQLVNMLEAVGADRAHIEAVRNQIGAIRIRPDEIVGAATVDEADWSVAFADARALADLVIADLAT